MTCRKCGASKRLILEGQITVDEYVRVRRVTGGNLRVAHELSEAVFDIGRSKCCESAIHLTAADRKQIGQALSLDAALRKASGRAVAQKLVVRLLRDLAREGWAGRLARIGRVGRRDRKRQADAKPLNLADQVIAAVADKMRGTALAAPWVSVREAAVGRPDTTYRLAPDLAGGQKASG